MSQKNNIPEWNLDDVFQGFGSDAYIHAKKEAADALQNMKAELAVSVAPRGASRDASHDEKPDTAQFADWLFVLLEKLDRLETIADTLSAYAYARFSTDTASAQVLAELNSVEELLVPAATVRVLFRNLIAANEAAVRRTVAEDPRFAEYTFVLEEALTLQRHQMSAELEDLVADLSRSGADAWSRLQESVLANSSAIWDEATGARKTMVELRNLAYDPDRSVRRKAYGLELDIWKTYEIPVAAALNGVKGTVATLNKRRGWTRALDTSLAQARISQPALDALIGAMEESLPMWRRYLHAKARLLSLETLSFYDIFAPSQSSGTKMPTFDWNDAKTFIVKQFGTFDAAMATFAERAFDSGWIDARPREGKVGGAFCTHFPATKQPRVLCNFDGSYSSLITIAHELGHAWHYETIKDMPMLLSQYPMTLAETASIFSETLVSNAAMAGLEPAAKLPLVELHLQDSCQVIVDILSRFYFERAVFEERKKGEITPAHFCELMLDAQAKTYGDALRADERHPYMWMVKGHYYIPGLSYYNFPYAFGLLFGLGLYSLYEVQGDAFAARYRELLRLTGSLPAVEVAARAGFDIETPDFWRGAMRPLAREVEFLEQQAD